MFDYKCVYFAPLGVELDSVPLVDEGVGRGLIVGSYDDPFGEGGGGIVAVSGKVGERGSIADRCINRMISIILTIMRPLLQTQIIPILQIKLIPHSHNTPLPIHF